MSDKADKVEAEAETDPEALFKEFEDQERAAAPDPKPEETEDHGDDAARSGQAASADPDADAARSGQAASESENQPDIWENATAEQRAAFEQSEKARRDAETLAKSHGARLAQAYQDRDALQARLEEAGKKEPDARQESDESDEDYRKRMIEDFPEFARLFDRLDATTSKVAALEGELGTVKTTASATQTEAILEEQGRVFTEAHPNWEAEKTDEALMKRLLEWAEGQPPYVQDVLRQNSKQIVDGPSAAHVISLFKRDTANPEAERQRERRKDQMDALTDATVNGPGATKTGAADSDIDGIWNELKAADERKAARTRRG